MFRFKPRKKINGFEDPLLENVFRRFFRFVLIKFCLFWLFQYRSKTPKQTKTNQKKCFLVSRNKPKNNRNRVLVRFGSNRKKKLIVSRTPYSQARMIKFMMNDFFLDCSLIGKMQTHVYVFLVNFTVSHLDCLIPTAETCTSMDSPVVFKGRPID